MSGIQRALDLTFRFMSAGANAGLHKHTVRPGETMSEIAKDHGVSLPDLIAHNRSRFPNPHRIKPGQIVEIPNSANGRSYIVKPDDTLDSIAREYGTTWQALQQHNGLAHAHRIYPGDVIKIPAGTATPVGTRASLDGHISTAPTSISNGVGEKLGGLSAKYEGGGKGVGTVSSGKSDPGGISYGNYQLATLTGTAKKFVTSKEASSWVNEFGTAQPGTAQFEKIWKKIAARDPAAFENAQHKFIERTHYTPLTTGIKDSTGLDLNARHIAAREASWSVSVQHRKAQQVLGNAIAATDKQYARDDARYDRALVKNIYEARIDYVRDVASKTEKPNEKAQLLSVTVNRYPAELRDALAMFNSNKANSFSKSNPTHTSPAGAVTSSATTRSDILTNWPVDNPRLNHANRPGEGDGAYGTHRTRGSHGGIDLVGVTGQPVYAAGAGKVVNIQPNPSTTFGYQIVIDHGNGVFTQYAHLQKGSLRVEPGDTVIAGQTIAGMGRSGNTPTQGDTHLHFEVRLGSPAPRATGGKVVNPMEYLGKIGQ